MARKKNILVVGGAGFIGTHICKALLDRGDKVISVDPRRDFKIEEGDEGLEEELWKAKSGGRLKTSVCTIQHFWHSIKHVEKAGAIDAVVVAAADPIDITTCENELGRAMKGHLEPLLASLQLAKYVGAGVVFLSSAAVYGEGEGKGALVEENALRHPPTFYGTLKLMGEQLVDYLAPGAALSARVFNVVGGSGVVTKFEEALASGKKAVIHGTGEQVRDFLQVGEVAERIALLASGVASGRIDDRTAVNICSGVGQSIIDVARGMGVPFELDEKGGNSGGMKEVVGNPIKYEEWATELAS